MENLKICSSKSDLASRGCSNNAPILLRVSPSTTTDLTCAISNHFKHSKSFFGNSLTNVCGVTKQYIGKNTEHAVTESCFQVLTVPHSSHPPFIQEMFCKVAMGIWPS